MKKIFFPVGLILLAGILVFISSSNKTQERQSVNKNSPKVTITNSITEETASQRYVSYSKEVFDKLIDKKRVYFFHAKWCPTCKVADAELMDNLNRIPEDVVVFKTDYDTEKALKTEYGITYQHTFVYIDSESREIKKWNGGGIEELIENTQ